MHYESNINFCFLFEKRNIKFRENDMKWLLCIPELYKIVNSTEIMSQISNFRARNVEPESNPKI